MNRILLAFLLIFLIGSSGVSADEVDDRIAECRKQLRGGHIAEAMAAITPCNDPRIVEEIAKLYKDPTLALSSSLDNVLDTATGLKVFEEIHRQVREGGSDEIRASFAAAVKRIGSVLSKSFVIKHAPKEKDDRVQYELTLALRHYISYGNDASDALYTIAIGKTTLRTAIAAVCALSSAKNQFNARLLVSLFNKGNLPDALRSEALFGAFLAGHEDLSEPVDRALKTGNPGFQVIALTIIADAPLKDFGSKVISFLNSKQWEVRAAAIKACSSLKLVESVGPLIQLWKKETGRLGDDIHRALLRITGKSFGADWRYWDNWFSNLEEPIVASDTEGEYVNYHGLKTRSKNMAFCIDFSGSMSAMVTSVESDYAGEGKKLKETTRMEMVKEELIRVIRSLKSDTYFNIIGFETNILRWRDGQVQATKENREAAISWVSRLEPTGGTNIFDALEAAFGLQAGKYAMTPDTIFLLSDGSPGAGRITDPAEILEEIGRINRTRNVIIHTIGVGTGGEAFLKSLAEQNGGIYRSVGE
ncbi:MAG: hypothetical protein Kow00107_06680 [Planctomycetota bacterium]